MSNLKTIYNNVSQKSKEKINLENQLADIRKRKH